MKEELKGPEVKDVYVAVVQEAGENDVMVYNVYVINDSEDILEQVLVTSKGYATSENTGEKIETTTLRKDLGGLIPYSAQKIEPIMEDVMALNNEYWVSFWIGNKMYDKKFIFLSESIKEENFVTVPVLALKGVMVG
ncbi:hypothetical protein CW751_02750 [Brumimicrobium salinarum]|uniref:Uncharacterized protein n=1 Tax=Brumimicrobium salinarum TaxID=2058658 RepID=A0A2I0R6Q1_9FLAO|nr:hypothetical protein [Brumimicrobium salinarum]PKR82268.1 hypothetical protein CW751_02750 [Brumimicrobium salinarum]